MQVKKPLQEVPIRYVKGVGPIKAELFKKLDIENISDLFYYLPRKYQDRSNIVKVSEAKPNQAQAIIGKVLKKNSFTAKTGTHIFELVIGDDKNRIFATWYNQPYMRNVFEPGQTVVVYGKVEVQKHLQIVHPIFEILDKEDPKESLDIGRIVPIYSLTEKITQKYIRRTIHNALETHLNNVMEVIPKKILTERGFVSPEFALKNIHFPDSFDSLKKSHKRLVYEEFFVLQTIMAIKRNQKRNKGIKHEIKENCFNSGAME